MVAQIDSRYRRHGIGKTLRRLASYAFFEGRPHTTKGQWFNPVVFSLLRILASLPGKPELKAPIFITGLGRSGTTILGVLLSLHKEVGFLNEPKAIWRLIDPKHDINGDYTPEGGVFRMTEEDITAAARSTSRRIFSRYLSVVRAKRLVDKYPELIFRVDYLLGLFPDAKIIFISRNGMDAIHSIDLWSKRLGVVVDGRVDDWWGRGDIKWQYLRRQLIQADPDYVSVKDLATADLDHINRAALEWIITMREGLKQLDKHPESVIHVCYEKLTSMPDAELTRLLDQCGLAYDSSVLDYAREKLYANPPKPAPELLVPINDLFNRTMADLGYSTGEH